MSISHYKLMFTIPSNVVNNNRYSMERDIFVTIRTLETPNYCTQYHTFNHFLCTKMADTSFACDLINYRVTYEKGLYCKM